MSRKKNKKKETTPPGEGNTRPVRAYELQHREKALLDLLHAYPNQVLRGLAKQPEAEWSYGRLYLVGMITQSQYEAALYLFRVTRNYETQLRSHGNIRASSFQKTDGMVLEDLSLSAQKRFARAKRKYDEVYDILDQCGDHVRSAIITVLRTEEKADLDAVQSGLTVLATGLFSARGISRQ